MRKSSNDAKAKHRHGRFCEPLEGRVMLASAATAGSVYDVRNLPIYKPQTANLTDLKTGPMANTGSILVDLYRDYRSWRKQGGSASSYQKPTSLASLLVFNKNSVAVTVRTRGSLDSLVSTIRSLGGQVIYRSGKYKAVDAFVPIGQLHSLAAAPKVATVNPIYRAIRQQQGSSTNQADQTLNADQVRVRYGLDGTGVKVGVISDSVDQTFGGIASSVATGDLPADGVQVIDDAKPYDFATDEGRAMLELIHDVAPGADLAFATALPSQQVFAANIRRLRAAGCDVIVDDIIYFAEPMFQPGIIDQAIHDVTQNGAVYLSSAGNNAQSGYEAETNFVKINGNYYVDFDPGPAVKTRMRITFPQLAAFSPQIPLIFQWDNPYNGLVGNATTDLDITFYDINYPKRIHAAGVENNLVTGLPMEVVIIPARTMDVEIRVADRVAGKALPTRFKFVTFASGTQIQTEFPENERAVYAHNGGPDVISVGAVPFYNAPPFADEGMQINNEDFSSIGPVTHIFDADGNRLSEPLTLNKPDISAIDGTNTSFFTGQDAFGVQLPLLGDIPQDDDSLPNFFGTSAAAPNAAAVVALMKQAAPGATQSQILSALQATARPVNGSPTGEWDPQGGFGLIDAVAAIEQFITRPVVSNIEQVSPNPTDSPVDQIKIIFSQQVNGLDVADLTLRVNGGPNLLTGNNQLLQTTDGGRTWWLTNLSQITEEPGTYVLEIVDDPDITGIVNVLGMQLQGGGSMSWQKVAEQEVPASPSGLTGKVLSDTAVQLRWQDNSDNETSFVIQRAEDKAFTANVKTFKVGSNVTSYTDSNILPAGKTLYYRVRAFNTFSGYSSYSSAVRVTTLSPGEIIIDNTSSSGLTVVGDWTTTSAVPGAYGGSYLDDGNSGKGAKNVRFTPNFEFEDDYYVYVRWSSAADRATNVPIDIYYDKGGQRVKTTMYVNQRSTGGGWVLLGKFHFRQGTFGFVRIRNDGTDGRVIADAVRFLSQSGGPAIPPTADA